MHSRYGRARNPLPLWHRAKKYPFGARVFSIGVALTAPYFRTVRPLVLEVKPGRVVVRAPIRWGIKNHIGTVHVIAGCNLAEMAMGLLCEATVPPTHRWIPKGMVTRYPSKSAKKGYVTAVAEIRAIPDFATITEGEDLTIPVVLTDSQGTEFLFADIAVWLSPKP